MNLREIEALARASLPDSPAKRRAVAKSARRTLAAFRAEMARREIARFVALRAELTRREVEAARRAEAVRLSDEYEAQRFAPFRATGPRPRGRHRAVMAVGTEDYGPPREMPPPPGVFDVGDDR